MRSVEALQRVGVGLLVAAGICVIGYGLVVVQGNMVFEQQTGGNGVYDWTPLEAFLFWSIPSLIGAGCVVLLISVILNRR